MNFRHSVKALRAANNLKTDNIRVGQKLKIPKWTEVAATNGQHLRNPERLRETRRHHPGFLRRRASGAGDGDALQLEHGAGRRALPGDAIDLVRPWPGARASRQRWWTIAAWRRFWWLLLAAAVVALMLVLVPHSVWCAGMRGAGSAYGGMSFQPSEFAKLALIVALAWYGDHFQRQMPTWKRGITHSRLLSSRSSSA